MDYTFDDFYEDTKINFSLTPLGQSIYDTINRYSECLGGATGVTLAQASQGNPQNLAALVSFLFIGTAIDTMSNRTFGKDRKLLEERIYK